MKCSNLKSPIFGFYLIMLLVVLQANATANDNLEIIHINVGQGDSTLILGPEENGNRVSILIDAGDRFNPDVGMAVLNTLSKYQVSKLDYFIATHYDSDHIAGSVTANKEVETTSYGTSFVFSTYVDIVEMFVVTDIKEFA